MTRPTTKIRDRRAALGVLAILVLVFGAWFVLWPSGNPPKKLTVAVQSTVEFCRFPARAGGSTLLRAKGDKSWKL